MADFTSSEILNEVSRIFRARLDVGRDGGTINTDEEYGQLLEMTSITFLLHNDAIYYLGKLISNRLNTLVQKEVAVVEDILVALDDLSQIGEPVEDTATLSNAYTALLALDAATTVQQRPETRRFSILMDQFAEKLRKNVVSSTGALVRPREDARNIIGINLERLKDIHSRLLEITFSLRDLMGNFVALDVPSKTSVTALANIRTNLKELSDKIDEASDAENIASSRSFLLRTLASKTAVNLIAGFTDPRQLKYRSPTLPIPADVKHYGQVTGEGEPARVDSVPGSWPFPISDDLELKVNDGSVQTVDFNTLVGMALNGSNPEPFNAVSSYRDLAVVVDPELRRTVVASTAGATDAVVTPYQGLGFKHLGAIVLFPDNGTTDADANHRAITELRHLQSFDDMTYVGNGIVTIDNATTVDDATPGLRAEHEGAYLYDQVTSERFEILEVLDPPVGGGWKVRVSIVDSAVLPSTGTGSPIVQLRGELASLNNTKIYFERALSASPSVGGRCFIGPTVKRVQVPTDATTTVQDIIDAVDSESGIGDPTYFKYAALKHHVEARFVAGDSTKLALAPRSRHEPYLQITSSFIYPDFSLPPAVSSVLDSLLHERIGIPIAAKLTVFDTNDMLTAEEAANAINGTVTGVVASVAETIVHESVLVTVESTKTVQDSTTDFTSLGVQVGDILEIRSGPQAGTFRIEGISTNTLTLRKYVNFVANEPGIEYQIKRQLVRIETARKTRGSSLEVVSSPSEFGMSAGVTYGVIPYFEAVSKNGELLEFVGLVPGDLLRIRGTSGEVPIKEVDGTTLELETGLSSNVSGAGFEIRSVASKDFGAMQEDLSTFTTARNLLRKNGFDENIDAIDFVLTTAVLPGQNFIANRNNARRVVAELLALLTSSPRRSDEYAASIPTATLNLEDIIADFDMASVQALDSIINAFLERKFDRAVDLLRSGKLEEFFDTDDETGSYSGAMISASRDVVRDLPDETTMQSRLEADMGTAEAEIDDLDAEIDFSDSDDEYEIDE